MADLTSNRVVLGYETTGFDSDGHFVEIACVPVSPEGQILEERDTLVNPESDPGSGVCTFELAEPLLRPRHNGTASPLVAIAVRCNTPPSPLSCTGG